jgi:hypothetical protein
MFEAQYLWSTDEADGHSVFSPWFPRQGDCIRYTLDFIHKLNGSPQIRVQLFHKNTEDTGDGSNTGSAIAFTSSDAQRHQQEFTSGLKELVRYKFTVKADSADVAQGILFRMLPPVWFDIVLAPA